MLKVKRQSRPVCTYKLINYPIVKYCVINNNNNTHIRNIKRRDSVATFVSQSAFLYSSE